jgi:uncharacterized surface anchored protein
VTLQPGEADDGNNFVDSNKGTISGNVTDPDNVPLPGAMVTLKDSGGNAVATMTTGSSDGMFQFPDLLPGDYTLEIANPPGYPDNASPNFIKVTLTP